MKKKINKNDRGITLIALIVTIIILIILVAVTIKAIAGDNLIDVAGGAATNYKSAEGKELNMLQNTSDRLSDITININGRIDTPNISVTGDNETTIDGLTWYGANTVVTVIDPNYADGTTKAKKVQFINANDDSILDTVNLDNGQATYTISSDGIYRIYAKLETSSGSTSLQSDTITFGRDTTGPSITSKTVTKTTTTSGTIKTEANDGSGCGIKKYEYLVGDSSKASSTTTDASYTGTVNDLPSGVTTTVTIKVYDQLDNSNSTTISVTTTKTIAKTITASNYGDSVNYSAGGVTDWKIFYNDGTYIFLIAQDYVNITDSMYTAMGASRSGRNVYWANSSSFKHAGASLINSTVASRFMLKSWYNSYSSSTNDNAKMTAALMDQNIWNYYVNDTYADYAIGGPTLEMWVASWNEVYPSDKLYTNCTSTGYYVGNTENPTSLDINYSSKSGYNNTLYWPYKVVVSMNGADMRAYWLVSPSSSTVYDEMDVEYEGNVTKNSAFAHKDRRGTPSSLSKIYRYRYKKFIRHLAIIDIKVFSLSKIGERFLFNTNEFFVLNFFKNFPEKT